MSISLSDDTNQSSETTFTNKKIGDKLTFVKVVAPADDDIEEGVIYFKEIYVNNNGWFSKCKKNGVLVEVQHA